MTHWWGEPWPAPDRRAPVCEDDSLRVGVPVGSPCMHCDELIEPVDQGLTYRIGYVGDEGRGRADPLHAHRECTLRSVMGCSAHLRGEPHDHEVPYREDARRVEQWLARHPVAGEPRNPRRDPAEFEATAQVVDLGVFPDQEEGRDGG